MNTEVTEYGPQTLFGQTIFYDKYAHQGETFLDVCYRQAAALADNNEHFKALKDIYKNQRFLNGGRIQAAMGSPRQSTPYNCFVSVDIEDSMEGIMAALTEAAKTLRLGGGIGYNFGTLRPKNALIKSLGSSSSGPVSFMGIYDALCKTIRSGGDRRGAQMGVLPVDHPDIEEFILAKRKQGALTDFNISVGITDAFMTAVKNDTMFPLSWNGTVYSEIRATYLWDLILRSAWDWAEPGVLFMDTINKKNNLWYCEKISATNPCGEQPLPPHGACLLGSFNLTKYIQKHPDELPRGEGDYWFDWDQFMEDIPHVVRALDNVVDRAIYPLPEQEEEAKSKRRMGIGITGLANTLEILGYKYGSREFLEETEEILTVLRDSAYAASINLALEKGAFPLFSTKMLDSGFAKTLPEDIRQLIKDCGIRNSHLLSIAPTGTISISADNVSSGIEPPFQLEYNRKYLTTDGEKVEVVQDYAYRFYGVKSVTADQASVKDHIAVLTLASKYVDSACSKTCNVGPEVTWEEYKNVYMMAYDGGASGCTTFRSAGMREGILTAIPTVDDGEGAACFIDPVTGVKSCE